MENTQARKNRFLFTITNKTDFSFSAQSVQIGDIALGTTRLQTSKGHVQLGDNTLDLSPISIQFVVDNDFKQYLQALNWIGEYTNDVSANEIDNVGEVLFLDSHNNVKMKILLRGMKPETLEGLDFSVNEDEVIVKTLTVVYEGIKITDIQNNVLFNYGFID